jgi:hypothetical protein
MSVEILLLFYSLHVPMLFLLKNYIVAQLVGPLVEIDLHLNISYC